MVNSEEHNLTPATFPAEPPEWEDFDEDEDVMDLRANHVLGGVFHFNLMALPPQPKIVNNWVITRSKFIVFLTLMVVGTVIL